MVVGRTFPGHQDRGPGGIRRVDRGMGWAQPTRLHRKLKGWRSKVRNKKEQWGSISKRRERMRNGLFGQNGKYIRAQMHRKDKKRKRKLFFSQKAKGRVKGDERER